jgi:hypothetical protein
VNVIHVQFVNVIRRIRSTQPLNPSVTAVPHRKDRNAFMSRTIRLRRIDVDSHRLLFSATSVVNARLVNVTIARRMHEFIARRTNHVEKT